MYSSFLAHLIEFLSSNKLCALQICVRYLSSSEREKVVYGIKPDTCYCFKEKPKLIFRTEKRERQSSNPLSPFPLQPQNETPPVFSANLSSINVYDVPSPSWHISLSSPAIIELMIVASVLFHWWPLWHNHVSSQSKPSNFRLYFTKQ